MKHNRKKHKGSLHQRIFLYFRLREMKEHNFFNAFSFRLALLSDLDRHLSKFGFRVSRRKVRDFTYLKLVSLFDSMLAFDLFGDEFISRGYVVPL